MLMDHLRDATGQPINVPSGDLAAELAALGPVTHDGRCCWIGCDAPAAYSIYASDANPTDAYTEACAAHVGPLLTDAGQHTVYRLPHA